MCDDVWVNFVVEPNPSVYIKSNILDGILVLLELSENKVRKSKRLFSEIKVENQ